MTESVERKVTVSDLRKERHLVRPTFEQLLALHKKLTGRDAAPEDVARLKQRMEADGLLEKTAK